MRACLLIATVLVLSVPLAWTADDLDRLAVGVQPDGRIVVPTNQILKPAGTQVTFPGRPVDLALADSGRTLVAKSMANLVFIDRETAKVKQMITWPTAGRSRVGFSVVGLVVEDNRIYASDAESSVRVAERQASGRYEWVKSWGLREPKVGGAAHPAGMAWHRGELWVASTRGNNVQQLDPATGEVQRVVPVGIAPYLIFFAGPDQAYVSNWGGDPPKENDPQALSSDSPIRIDPKTGIANDGTVSVLRRMDGEWKQIKTIRVGLHPCGMALSQNYKLLYVANANSDTVSVIDTATNAVVETIACRPEGRLPFGSGSNALTLSPDGGTLYVANGTNNCLAVIHLGAKVIEAPAGRPAQSTLVGLIPTGWYPGTIVLAAGGRQLCVANIKGHGALSQQRPADKGKMSKDHLGSVSLIDVPDLATLARYTAEVNANNRLGYSLAGLDQPRPDTAPVPVPYRHGEPSVFQHVIYIIKENRTYDQVFGALKEGNGDARLVMFGEDVTPNHHALAWQFTLFDNFYCSGVLSADGHNWVNEAYVTDYLERSFGGWTRSYPDDGSDPLAAPATGHLWDNALKHGKTFRNLGEYVNADYAPKGTKWIDLYNDYKNGTKTIKLDVRANIKGMRPHTHPGYPWFPLITPDVYRANLFIEELKEWEQKGMMPNLVYVTLPCDHTTGTKPDFPTPRASVADNDLALGRIVEAVSKSKFWPRTCIFVVEDDPQDGFDHVDAHRTVALAISPYTKRQFVDHTHYNQTGTVKTIELILGLPPMNQLDLSATSMRNCFQDRPDLTPYTCLPSKVPLDEMNPPLEKLQGKALYWAKKSMEIELDEGDEADEDTLNRILWHATRGYDTPYPMEFTRKGTKGSP